MSDESLREFQLNGKQLVFLFMASTIVAVVIFLCGVMVGRGVSAAQAAVVTNSTVEGDPTAGAFPEPAPAAPSLAPADVPPDTPGDNPELSYPGSLTADKPKVDLEPARAPAKPPAPRTTTVVNAAAPVPPVAPKSTPTPAPAAAARATERVADVEPAGAGFVVQVVATPRRAEADAINARLQKKGYPAYVTPAGRVFRVRVGKYKDRAEATRVSKRLQTEERFKPWVTR